MPPKPPDIAHFDTGRTSRLVLPNGICPGWFKNNIKVLFVPLFWKDDLNVSDTRKIEALLICDATSTFLDEEWIINPAKVVELDFEKPELNTESLFVFESKLMLSKQQWKLTCPPIVKGMCDKDKRVLVAEHSLGVSVWSPPAFNEHFG